MFKLINRLVGWFKYHFSHEWCYDSMEMAGIASMGRCCGVAGGNRESNYLAEMCMDCPHWVP